MDLASIVFAYSFSVLFSMLSYIAGCVVFMAMLDCANRKKLTAIIAIILSFGYVTVGTLVCPSICHGYAQILFSCLP